jgi:hypothetical protein
MWFATKDTCNLSKAIKEFSIAYDTRDLKIVVASHKNPFFF